MEALFVELLMEESNAGRIINAEFNIPARATITVVLHHSGLTRFRLTSKQMKGKWNRMKMNYNADTVEGTNEAWANLMKSRTRSIFCSITPRVEYGILVDDLSAYDGVAKMPQQVEHTLLCTVLSRLQSKLGLSQFDTCQASFDDSKGYVDHTLTPNNSKQLQSIPMIEILTIAMVSCHLGPPVVSTGCRHLELPSLGSKGKKAKLESEMSDACRAMTNLCNSKAERGSSSRGYQREPPINQCIHWPSSLNLPLPKDQYENAVDRLLKDKYLQNALMAMPVERRMVQLSQLVGGGV
ncbi:hypothetical protein CJ030_MR4G020678 [Morella rubra]|uniref:Uncharacterized protein n=1 Tax=Morella rubra TaxID=262757 RepID=A0A6A1VT83_9ROSI|nr:hypothetical protein CJ030_MR4G020678 [Morella rubra]